jgi:7-carboxy-7-deazaguanine synthase
MRLSEVYPSVQGEGPRAGIPTTFVRFAGCNLKCPGWPCDTPHAIDPKLYRKQWKEVTPGDLLVQTPMQPQNVCLTGGEPFLQSDDELKNYAYGLWDRGHDIEVFTNGTFLFPPWASNVSLTMDWKLDGSGEKFTDEQNRTRIENLKHLGCYAGSVTQHGVIKFTLNSTADLTQAVQTWSEHILPYYGLNIPIYVGVVWNGELTNAVLVELLLQMNLPWHLTMQMHNIIWDPQERGR